MATGSGKDAWERSKHAARVGGQRLWQETRETWRLMHEDGLKLANHARELWQARQMSRQALAAKQSLGQRLHELGLADADAKERIASLQERILSLQAVKASTKAVEAELAAERLRLASESLATNSPPPGAELQFNAAREANAAWQTRQQTIAASRAHLMPASRDQSLRLGAGCAAVCLALVAGAWAVTPGTSERSQVQAPNVDAPPNGDGGDPVVPDDSGGQVGYPSNPPVGVVPPVYSSPTERVCYNCNGTGQANCTACYGKGTSMCYACNGNGKAVNSPNPAFPTPCFQCQGSGRQDCSFCQYGKVYCTTCGGDGKL